MFYKNYLSMMPVKYYSVFKLINLIFVYKVYKKYLFHCR